MTNIEKVKRILDAGHWVKVTWADGEINTITSYKENINKYDSYSFISEDGCMECDVDIGFNNCTTIEVIQRIPTPYKPGDKVLVLSNPSPENKKIDDMVGKVCKVCEIFSNVTDVWDTEIDNSFSFPAHCLAPVFDEPKLSGKEVTVTIEGKEYSATLKLI